ncbi:hypothetical protein DFH08DRAFT_704859, partial [Mycena albidolilacea]
IVPAGFAEYPKETWLKDNVVCMWSGVYRTRCDILTFCDTNMLLTPHRWHYVLKGKFFEGKRNQHLDHFLHTLIECVIPYYALKQHHQAMGFESPDA